VWCCDSLLREGRGGGEEDLVEFPESSLSLEDHREGGGRREEGGAMDRLRGGLCETIQSFSVEPELTYCCKIIL
jgi:hypothetical protein